MNLPLKENKRVLMIAAIVVVFLLLGTIRWFVTYSPKSSSKKDRAKAKAALSDRTPAVRAFHCKKVNFIDNLVLTGTIQGGARAELRFQREGRIQKVKHRIGDKVKKGAVIATLDTGEAAIKRQQAEAELSQALDLYKAGAIAKPRLTQARLAAQLARKEYQRSYLTAPQDGTIGESNAEVGEYVTPQNTVATIVSVGKVFVEMGVIERDLSKLHLNQNVNVKVETYPDVVFKGKIARIAPMVEGTSRTRTVRAEIPNKKGLLLPGMFARAEIFILEKPDSLVVPASAVRIKKEKAFVYVLKANQKLKEVPVSIGYESADYTEIESGLKEGDVVVSNLSDRLREGLKVEVVEEIEYQS